jgi:RNA polymerase sigma-70 factor (ECF subfamily)
VNRSHAAQQARFDEVLDQYRGRLGRIALTYAGHESDDLLQEILLQIWRSLRGFREQSSIGTWCYRIAINTAISWKRKTARKKVELASSELDQLPSAGDASMNQAGLLKRFLESLGEVDQTILLMHLENVEHSEIAAAIGVTEGAIRTRMSRLRQKLAAWEAPLGHEQTRTIPAREAAHG